MKNLECKSIDSIYIIVEDIKLVKFIHPKLYVCNIKKRADFADLFRIARKVITDDTISIISNADIFYDDENLKLIQNNIKDNECYALTRWEWNYSVSDPIHYTDRGDSQDCWIFKNKIKDNIDSNFKLGIPGCDNRLAYSIKAAGYDIKNPSRTIKTYHMHKSNFRTYTEENRIRGEYLRIPATSL